MATVYPEEKYFTT